MRSIAVPNVAALLAQLTDEEKVSLLAGQSFFETKAIRRLGIPAIKFTDGPNGARGGTVNAGHKAACFPASVSLAATWDREAVYRVTSALAEETKTKGAVAILGPTICPHRSPLGGRNFESFSEDPYLAGVLASRYVDGLQDNGIAAVVKHFAGNEQETMRRMIDVIISQRALREIYLKPFEMVAKLANPWAFMTSYNLLNGHHADMSEYLLRRVLREEWRYEGLVVSDWGGTNSTVESLNVGMDLEMPGPPNKRKWEAVQSALKDGKVSHKTIDESARHVLEFVRKTGKFANPETPPERSIINPEHSRIIRQTAAEGMVLLRNEGNLLPLQPSRLKSVALLGLAKECLAHGGGSAKVNCHYKVTPYDAIQRELADEGVEVLYEQGAQTWRNAQPMKDDLFTADGVRGVKVSHYANRDMSGTPWETTVIPTAKYLPNFQDSKSRDIQASLTLEATFKPSATGNHYLGFSAIGPSKLYVDGELLLECGNSDDPVAYILSANNEQPCRRRFVAGRSYDIRVESLARLTDIERRTPNSFFDGLLSARVGFMAEAAYEEDILPAAVDAASSADVAIVFVGNPAAWETEGQDMSSMSLPAHGSQDRLVAEVAKVNKNTLVVSNTGVPFAMPWLSSTRAVLQAWFPGMEAGNSMADVLFGRVNPSGRLPVTFPKSLEYTPCYDNFPGDLDKLEVRYEEGVFMGYRHYDLHPDQVLYPFGFGLSYTSFSMALVDAQGPDARKVNIQVEVKNTGKLAGNEVVQGYLGKAEPSADQPLKALAGFTKVRLEPGESTIVRVDLDLEAAAWWDEERSRWRIDEGQYEVLVGHSAVDIVGRRSFVVPKAIAYEA